METLKREKGEGVPASAVFSPFCGTHLEASVEETGLQPMLLMLKIAPEGLVAWMPPLAPSGKLHHVPGQA